MFGDLSVAVVGLIAFLVILFFVILIGAFSRYKKCPSDKILVIYGKVQKETSAKCIHGGAAFVWPLIQSHRFLDLTPMSIEVNLTNALSKQNIRVDVPSRFTVGISTDRGIMEKAAERLLGLKHNDIIELSKDILFGQLRLVIATMDIEEINTDRDKFLDNVSKNVEAELNKIGLKLINVNVTDIRDESFYIEALGKEAAAKAINDAKVSVAQRDRDGSIGEATANKEKRVQVSEAETLADKGVAEAESRKRVSIAAANAQAVDGENLSRIQIAESESEKNTKQTQAESRAIAARRIAESEAEQKGYDAKRIAEQSRAAMEKMSQKADIIVAAEIAKEKVEIDSEAEAERIRRIAQGNADAKLKQMQAEALGMYQILEKKADGFRRLVEAAGDSSDMAIKLLLAEQMTDLLGIQAGAIKDMKIDQVTVWSNGEGGENGKSSVSGYVHDLFKMLPPLQDILSMKGMGLPEFLTKPSGEEIAETAEAGTTEVEANEDDIPELKNERIGQPEVSEEA